MLLERQLQITVFILTNDGLEALGDLTQYTSIKWPNAFVGYGSFEVWAPISSELVGLIQFTPRRASMLEN